MSRRMARRQIVYAKRRTKTDTNSLKLGSSRTVMAGDHNLLKILLTEKDRKYAIS